MSLFGDRLRKRREGCSMRREELASLLGVSRNTIGFWERGERLPRSLEQVYALANILHVPMEFFSDAQDMESRKDAAIQDLDRRVTQLEHSLGKDKKA